MQVGGAQSNSALSLTVPQYWNMWRSSLHRISPIHNRRLSTKWFNRLLLPSSGQSCPCSPGLFESLEGGSGFASPWQVIKVNVPKKSRYANSESDRSAVTASGKATWGIASLRREHSGRGSSCQVSAPLLQGSDQPDLCALMQSWQPDAVLHQASDATLPQVRTVNHTPHCISPLSNHCKEHWIHHSQRSLFYWVWKKMEFTLIDLRKWCHDKHSKWLAPSWGITMLCIVEPSQQRYKSFCQNTQQALMWPLGKVWYF